MPNAILCPRVSPLAAAVIESATAPAAHKFCAPGVTPPLPKTEAAIPPVSQGVRRALLVTTDDRGADVTGPDATVAHGRWDSARVAALGFFIRSMPHRPPTIPTADQLEFHFA